MNERVKAPKGVESVLLPLNLMFALLCWFAGFDGEGTGRKVLAWTLFISTVTSLSISLWIWFLAGVSFFLSVLLGKRTGPHQGAIFCVVENWAKPVLVQRLKQSPNRLMRDAMCVSIFFLVLIHRHRHLFYIFCICVLHLMPATVLTTDCSFSKNLLHVT